MPAPFVFDRRWAFPVAAEELWAVLTRTDDYPRWWSWLERFSLDGTDGLAPGATARFSVRPPLPYRLHVTVAVDEVVEPSLVVATIGGDVAGPGRLEVTADGPSSSTARLAWSLELRRPTLVTLERLARPAMVWGHDTVVALGVRQFRRRALGGR